MTDKKDKTVRQFVLFCRTKKYSNRGITYETLEKAVSGNYNAMQEVIRLFKPYMTKLSIEDGRFDKELFERRGTFGI